MRGKVSVLKKITAVLIIMMLLITLIPFSAFASEPSEDGTEIAETVETEVPKTEDSSVEEAQGETTESVEASEATEPSEAANENEQPSHIVSVNDKNNGIINGVKALGANRYEGGDGVVWYKKIESLHFKIDTFDGPGVFKRTNVIAKLNGNKIGSKRITAHNEDNVSHGNYFVQTISIDLSEVKQDNYNGEISFSLEYTDSTPEKEDADPVTTSFSTTFNFDNKGPAAPTLTQPDTSIWYNADNDISITAVSSDDGCGVNCIYYDSSVNAGNSVTVKYKGNTIEFYAEDNLGNKSESVTSSLFNTDTESPVLSSSVAKKDLDKWYDKSLTFTLEAADEGGSGIDESTITAEPSDNVTIKKKEDGKFDVSVTESGSYSFTVKDNARNVSNTVTLEDVKIDKERPQKDDFHVIISAAEKNPVLRYLSFGLYSNTVVKVTVRVSPNGGSPINEITFAGIKAAKIEEKDGFYTADFELSSESSSIFDLNVSAKDEIDKQTEAESKVFKLSEIAESIGENGKNLKELLKNPEDWVLLITNAVPYVESYTITGDGTEPVFDVVNNIKFTVKDGLCDVEDERISKKASLNSVGWSLTIDEKTTKSSSENLLDNGKSAVSTKTINVKDTIDLADDNDGLSEGKHIFTVKAENSAGNSMEPFKVEFEIDKGSKNSISDIQYEVDKKFADSQENNWTKEERRVRFKVETGSTGLKDITVKGKTTESTFSTADGTLTKEKDYYYFSSGCYEQYEIIMKDNLYDVKNNEDYQNKHSRKAVTEYILFDDVAPVIDELIFDKGNYLTFGIYSENDVNVTLKLSDNIEQNESKKTLKGASGFIKNAVKIDKINKAAFAPENVETKPDDPQASQSLAVDSKFTISTSTSVYTADQFKITVTDRAGNSTTYDSLKAIAKTRVGENEFTFDDDYELGFVTSSVKEDTTKRKWENVTYLKSSEEYFNRSSLQDENSTFTFSYTDDRSKLWKIEAQLNGNDISSYVFDMKYVENKNSYTDHEKHTGEKTSTDTVTIHLKDIPIDKFNIISGPQDYSDGKNVLSIKVYSNNSKSTSFKDEVFYVDDQAPVITEYDFINTSAASDASPVVPSEVDEFYERTRYGYYFKEDGKVTITADDKNGSGIDTITLYLDGRDPEIKTVNSKNKATFDIPASYKGRIYAISTDKVHNDSKKYAPDDVIAETEETFSANTDLIFTLRNTNLKAQDNNKHKLYDGDVTVDIKAQSLYSGIHKIKYTISSEISGASASRELIIDQGGNLDYDSQLTSWSVDTKDKNLVTQISGSFVVDCQQFKTNNNKITAVLTDRSGHQKTFESELFSIDITPPVIEVRYEPATAVNTDNGTNYFSTSRRAIITVTEANFDPNNFDWTKAVNNDGAAPSHGGLDNWSTSYGDYSNESKHTAELVCSTDGDYVIDFGCKDQAGHSESSKPATEKFTIDLIKPTISVSFDNISSQNGSYYKANRTATITIVEHNFSPDAKYLTYSPTATGPDNSSSATAPQINGWSRSGDTNTASISFATDGKYSFNIDYKDLALNEAQRHTEPVFYIDTKIDDLKIVGVEKNKPYEDDVEPGIVYKDYNFAELTYTLERKSWDYENLTTDEGKSAANLVPDEQKGSVEGSVTWPNFDRTEQNDGIYEITATITDKAGNSKSTTQEQGEFLFSVNRYGSTFMTDDDSTMQMLNSGFTTAAKDIVVKEINVNKVVNQKVSLSYNSDVNDLVEGTDYKLTHSGNGVDSWYQTTYTVDSKNFSDEGDYTLTLFSTDPFKNTVSNRTANTTGEIERNLPIQFTVDSTAPEIYITGVKDDEWLADAEIPISVTGEDVNIDKESLQIFVDDKPLAKDSDFTLEDQIGGIVANFVMKANGNSEPHTIKAVVRDLAGQEKSSQVKDFHLSANIFERFLHNTTALLITGGVVLLAAAGIILLSLRKKSAKK